MPLLVKTLLPFHTMRMLPVWLFLVTRLGLRVAERGLVALRVLTAIVLCRG